jgi:prepilin peptidase CpaA
MIDPFYQSVLYVAFGLYLMLLATAAGCDLWKFIIPNVVSIALVLLFVVTALLLPFEVAWLSHFGAALACFAVGALFFAFGWMGAGDVKLLTALALWAGFQPLPQLLLYVCLAGGAFALFMILLRKVVMSLVMLQSSGGSVTLPRILLVGEKIPYGVALTFGGVMVAFDLPHLGLYL